MFESRFQTFTDLSEPGASAGRLAGLRTALAGRGLDGFVVPHADRHQNEYLPVCDERLAWLLGFTGSAGRAVVLAERAVLFVDGRYTLQAREQTDPAVVEIVHLADVSPEQWLEQNLPPGARLGYDPWLHTRADVDKLGAACSAAGASLVAADPSPLDAVWRDRPAPPLGAVTLHDLAHAGEAAEDKLARIRAEIAKARADLLVVSNTSSVAWAFNLRGADVTHTPIALAFALVPREGRPSLYVDGRKLSNAVRDSLERLADLREPDALAADLAAASHGRTVRLDQTSAAETLAESITAAGGKLSLGADPIAQMKAVKNDTEIAGARAAQQRDGAAVVNFLAWLDAEATKGGLTEIDCVKALESFRRAGGDLRDVSFPTIAGSGPNGAIVHYRVTEKSNRRLGTGELFLVDSGGQYLDGTTDITRTVAIGAPSQEMRERFTRVLKGHIAIARAVFPDGAGGAQLDSFARQHLWRAGLDYDHGTGHGVGSFLSVHEGPASIHKANLTALKRGMILSNEPGYYKTGAYGIRIENLLLVVAAPKVEGAERPLNAFETLTLAPIDRRLIETRLLDADERDWLNAYHARVAAELSPRVEAGNRAWLAAACAPLP